jgi:hypothetical protein
MFDGISGAVPGPDRDDVEPALHVSQPAFEEITLGHLPNLLLFGRRHGFLGPAEDLTRPHLDLDENERFPVAGDDVDLAAGEAEPGFNDLVFFATKVLEGYRLACSTKGLRGLVPVQQVWPFFTASAGPARAERADTSGPGRLDPFPADAILGVFEKNASGQELLPDFVGELEIFLRPGFLPLINPFLYIRVEFI